MYVSSGLSSCCVCPTNIFSGCPVAEGSSIYSACFRFSKSPCVKCHVNIHFLVTRLTAYQQLSYILSACFRHWSPRTIYVAKLLAPFLSVLFSPSDLMLCLSPWWFLILLSFSSQLEGIENGFHLMCGLQ